MTRWQRLRHKSIKFLLVAIAILFATSVYARGVEPRWFEIKTIDITIAGLNPVFEGYRIVQLSDLHARSGIMDRQQLAKVANIANRQQPDLIALTGDYVTDSASKAEAMLASTFSQLQATDGVVAIMGNHDREEDHNIAIERAFSNGKVNFLNNAVYSIDRHGHKLNIAGVDDVYFERANLPLTISQLPQTGTNILLAHEPDFVDIAAATDRFGLQLSGHSHGGQIVLPLLPRVTALLAKKYISGLYTIGETQLYVSSGVGTSGLPQARFNCRPEISVIVLHPDRSASLP
ncbi:metallophosphoesterase [Chamaesiphon sp. VAR_48_metabat_135_sub]|uniref:metallophosphoesterase n=1 Tax=Chamaesiphon sp. VAR_48_metabat_135_sub TaxID=2964699 RepID=UPI00286C6BC3|nr:metallophosphoesterase [Chamaesiphon sp. VAR_48_metabat_135_sub]